MQKIDAQKCKGIISERNHIKRVQFRVCNPSMDKISLTPLMIIRL